METANDTIGGMLEKIAQRYPDRDALIHPEKGQKVVAWVKMKENAQLDEQDLVTFSDAHVAEGMRPRYFKIVNDFPMTRSGKV